MEAMNELLFQEFIEKAQAWDELQRRPPTAPSVRAYLDRWCNSYERLPALMELYGSMNERRWWGLLGQYWSLCDNIADYTSDLRDLLQRAEVHNLRSMMTPTGRRRLARLPEKLTVFRGCFEVNRDGLSWSLSECVARHFPTLPRYARAGEQAFLLTGQVAQSRAVLILDRNEEEVISADVQVIQSALM